MSIDWTRGDLSHHLSVLMVDPSDLTTVRGELAGVTGGTLTLQYYGDTRMGAELTTVGDHGWDGSAALRVVHTVSDWTGTLLVEALITGLVTGATWEGEGADLTTTWTLASTLHGAEAKVAEVGLSIAKGSKALAAISRTCATIRRACRIDPSASDYIFGASKVYEAGTSYLAILLDVCDASDNRLSVDADGTITVSGYVSPSARTADYSASELDPRGTVIGPVSGATAGLDAPARVIVRGESDDKSVTGIAEVAAGAPSSEGVRGWSLDRFEAVSDLSPLTEAAARAKAKKLLDADLASLPSIAHGLLYRPLREGDVELLTRRDGSRARWMVSGATLDLVTWTWALDLKGGWTA